MCSSNSQNWTDKIIDTDLSIDCVLRDWIVHYDGRQAIDESPGYHGNTGRRSLVLPHRVHCPDLSPVQLHAPPGIIAGVQTPVL